MALVVAGPGSWRLGYGLLVVAFAAVALCLRRVDLPDGAVTAAHGDEPPLPAPPRHRSGLVCAVVLFFVYVGVELTAAQWSYSLFTEVEGMGEVAAGVWVGAFWAGFTAIRIVSGLAGPRWHGVLLLDLSLATAALGAGLLWWTPVPFVGGVGLVIVGVGTGLVFPTLVSLTPRRVGGERTPQAIGYQVGAAAVGAAAIPALFGVAAEEYGLEILGPVLVVGIAVLIVLHRLAVILER
jgi:fucose permease